MAVSIMSRCFLEKSRSAKVLLRCQVHKVVRQNSLAKGQQCSTSAVHSSARLPPLQSNKKFAHASCIFSAIHHRNFRSTTFLCADVLIVKTPGFPESVSEGDVRWEKAVGDSVAEDEVIGEIETDKTALPIHAPKAGIIEEFLVQSGEKVVAGQQILKLNTSGAAPSKPVAKDEKKSAPTPTSSAPSTPKTTPSPKPTARASGPAPTTPAPPPLQQPVTSPSKGETNIATPGPLPPGDSAVWEEPTPPETRTEKRVKMNRMRLRIAQRLKDAQNTCAMLTTFNEIDMSNLNDMRARYKDGFQKKHNIKVGFMTAFIKASAYALQDQPIVNAVIDENEIVYRDYVDISVAVATPKGLVVPVLRNAETMNYAEIEKGLNELGEKARAGALAIEDMDGGTFTISNGGVFGSMFGTPIINPPQSAILGMHGVFDRPVALNGKVEIRPMMYVALTYDHRLIDGREAVLFLRKIKAFVEDPRIMLLDI